MSTTFREHRLRFIMPIVAAALLAPLPQAAHAQSWAASQRSPLQEEIADRASKELKSFYAARQFRPLWLNEFGRPSGAASMLMNRLRTAQYDGLDPKTLRFARLAKLVEDAQRGGRRDVAKAEVELSEAFAAYVRGMRAVD